MLPFCTMFRLVFFILGVSALFICPYPGLSCLLYSGILAHTYSRSPQYGVPTRYHSLAKFISILVFTHWSSTRLPYILRSEIPYQSISPLITIHICHFHSYNLIFLLSLHNSPFQISPCLLSTGACHAPVLIIKEELPSETLRHSSSVQILFSRPFPFFLCRGSFEFSVQVTHDHLVQFLL